MGRALPRRGALLPRTRRPPLKAWQIIVLSYAALWTVIAIGSMAGCGGTYTIRTEQVPSASRTEWEVDITDRVNKLDIRLKKLEQTKEGTDA